MFSAQRIEVINSAYRNTGTNESFNYVLNFAPDEQYDYVCVLFANIPISYYLVTSGFNTFTLSETKSSVTKTMTITVPIGNYSANAFLNIVAPTSGTGGLLSVASTANGYGCTYNGSLPNAFTSANTGQFTFTVSNNSGVTSSFIFSTVENDMINNLMGFAVGSTNTFMSNSLTSTNVVNFIPETTLYIYSDLIETKDNNTLNVLQELYGENNTNFSNIVYQCTTVEGYSRKINKRKSNSFTMTLVNENGVTMNLNGQPWFVTLLFYKLDFYDIVKRYIKYKLMAT